MRRSKALVISSLVALAAALSSTAATTASAQETAGASPTARRMRLEECVSSALEKNVDIQSAAEDVHSSEAARAVVKGQFGPKLKADASITQYNQAYVVLGFPVHDALTWNVTASIVQPLSGLFVIYDAYKVSEFGVDIAAIRREVIRRETAFRVIESYYRLLQGERLADVASASIEQLDGQLRQAKSFHANGVVSQDDVLRAQLAVANAQQSLIQIRAKISLERSRLAVLIGLPADADIDAQPLPADQPPPRDNVTLEQAEKTAELQRVELREVDRRIEQSGVNVSIAKAKYAPRVDAIASYVHNEGSLFSPFNSAYVGATASWDIWDWGTTTGGVNQAKALERQAFLARTKVNDQIRIEVRKAFLDVGAASEAMSVAQASVASAEENFRLVKKRYEANAATSFAVVDAEGLLTQARGQMQTALYDFVVSRAALRSAMGGAPEALARP